MMPARRLIIAVVLLWLSAIAVPWSLMSATLWQALLLTLCGLAVIDRLLTRRQPRFTLQRAMPGSFPVGVPSRVELVFSNPGNQDLRLRVYDHHPGSFRCRDFPADLRLPARRQTHYRYSARPTERGDHLFSPVQCRVLSPLGLWWRDKMVGARVTVRVYPNFAAVTKYALLAHEQRLPVIGVLKQRRRGQGSEFHQLREYRPGDSLTQVDWRATARMRKLISREYQDERNQTVLFLLDCGRRMRAQDGDLSHFDQALNAVLLLAYVALRNGDSVGVSTFSGTGRWLAPGKGQGSVNRILNTLYDLQPSTQTPDYLRAASELLVRHPKRSLVVMVTNLRDEDSQDLEAGINVMKRKHLVLLASLREQAVDDSLRTMPDSFDAALQSAAAAEYADQRHLTLDKLRNRGVLSMDVLPQQLSVQLVNHYLAIKAQGIL
jgi:uncharacterized protein (DUF58 family)